MLSQNYIDEILSIYKEDHRYLHNVEYSRSDRKISGVFYPIVYPYTIEPTFDYVTSVTATLFVCQLAYVLYTTLIDEQDVDELNYLNHETFLNLISDAKLKFMRYKFKFFAPVYNCGMITGSMKLDEVIKKKNKVFYRSSFWIGHGMRGELLSFIID